MPRLPLCLWVVLVLSVCPAAGAQTAEVPVALDAASVATAGTAVTALAPGHHGHGGWLRNCNASGTLYVNDNGAATQTETGSNAALYPGEGGQGQRYDVPAGLATISVTGSQNGMTICGEGYN